MTTARTRYNELTSYRTPYLQQGIESARLTLPYLLRDEGDNAKGDVAKLPTPWQAAGADGVITLASKLMLAMLPIQTSFFKLQVKDEQLAEEIATFNRTAPEDKQLDYKIVRSELDTSLAKQERQVMETIAESKDRVVLHELMKHLVVVGNGLIYLGKTPKFFPLNRFVLDRDGNDNLLDIVTKERVSYSLVKRRLEKSRKKGKDNVEQTTQTSSGSLGADVDIYTYVKFREGKVSWHQEVDDVILTDSISSAKIEESPWVVGRFNKVDGELYGRGRVEEYFGDLKSLEALSQAVVEGAAVSARVIFLIDPSSTISPATLAALPNGGIAVGKEGSVTAVRVEKAADMQIAEKRIMELERRINKAFLVMQVRDSERTTADEVRILQNELNQQQGGLFSLLTSEVLIPYLKRTLFVQQKQKLIKPLPYNIVKPTLVAGVNALGRGQDRDDLIQLATAISAAFGPDAVKTYLNPIEFTKRLVAAMGVDSLNLARTQEELNAENEKALQQQKDLSITNQTAALAKSPMMDPTKNPQALNDSNQAPGQDAANQDGPQA